MSECFNEIIGVRLFAFYINKDVTFYYPDPNNENQISLITHGVGTIVINDANEYPKWERIIDYSGNYRPNYVDNFSFYIHGIQNETPEILRLLRSRREGFIVEMQTQGGQSYVFKTPVFVNEKYTKQINMHSWEVVMSYRVPTFDNYLTKTNNMVMSGNYIWLDENSVLGQDGAIPIVTH